MPRIYDDISLGRRLRQRSSRRFSIAEVVYEPLSWMPMHAHAQASFSFVLRGGVEETCGDVVHVASPGFTVFKPAFTAHANCFGERGAAMLAIRIHDDADNDPETDAHQHSRYAWSGTIQAGLAGYRLYRAFHLGVADDELEDLVIDLMAAQSDEACSLPARPEWLGDLCALMKSQVASPMRVSDLAHRFAVHPVYLARVFRRYLGCGVCEYRQRAQVNAAAQRFADTDDPPALVSVQTGFSDQSHLGRVFRRYFGTSPAAFRRLHRG